jgi:Secretion system C-terminal sorting domain
MKQFIGALLLLVSIKSNATNYYVSGTGNDTNNGLSTTTAFRTIQIAADTVMPGDTVFVMNGLYVSADSNDNAVNIRRKGTNSQWIVFKNYTNHTPKIFFFGWGGFAMQPGSAYIEINGFEIQGSNDNVTLAAALNQSKGCNNPNPGGNFEPLYNGNGISSDGMNVPIAQKPHHIRILNNTIYDCGGAGIGMVHSDYITVRNNLVYDNSWYTLFGTSGISLYQCFNYDNNTSAYRNVIEGNISHHNRLYVPWVFAPCAIYDGNGIILDDFNNTQNNSTSGIYNGKTLVRNNIVYRNGGSGMHSYLCRNVDFINNTAYKNSQSYEVNNGEIFASNSKDCKIINNILYADTNNIVNSSYSDTNTIYLNNLHFSGTTTAIFNTTCLVANPNFVNEAANDFHLQSNSPCIDNGNAITYAPKDFDENTRPQGIRSDIGAYEFLNSSNLKQEKIKSQIKLYPNPSKGKIYFEESINENTVSIFNILGQAIPFEMKSNVIDISAFPNGIYKILMIQNGIGNTTTTLVKE